MHSRLFKELIVIAIVFIGMLALYRLAGFHYSFNRDTWHYNYSLARIVQPQISQGTVPFIDPYSGLGTPLLLRGSFDILTMPLLLLIEPKDYLVSVGFLYLLLGIFFMYRFLVGEDLDPWASLAGAVVWGTNGFFLWHLHELALQSSAALIPLQLCLIRSLFADEGRYRGWVLLSVVTALQLSFGRWDIVEYGIGAGMLYALCRSMSFREAGRTVLFISAAVAAGMLISAPFSLNYIKTIIGSYRVANSLPIDYYPFYAIIEHLFPNVGRYDSRGYIALYIFPCFLVALFRPRRLVFFGLLLSGIYVLLAYPFKIYELLRMLPMHSGNVTIIRLNILFYLGISIIGTYGMSRLFSDPSGNSLWIALSGAALLGVISAVIFRVKDLSMVHFLSVAVCVVFFVLMAVIVYRGWLDIRPLRKYLAIAMILYAGSFSWYFNKTDRNDGDLGLLSAGILSAMRDSTIENLRGELAVGGQLSWRVVTDDSFHPAFLPMNLIPTTNIYGAFPSITQGRIATQLLGNDSFYSTMLNTGIGGREGNNIFYSLASVRYFLVRKTQKDRTGVLIHNEEALPPIRFCRSYQVVPDEETTFTMLANHRFDINAYTDHCLIDADPLLKETDGTALPTYTVIDARPDRISLRVTAAEPSLMVISNRYDPSWRLLIDSHPAARLYKVNGFLQGIAIQRGVHRYELRYFPADLVRNLIIAGATLVVLLLMPVFYSGRPKAS